MTQAEYCDITEDIPTGYKIYTLFLIPSYEWSNQRKDIAEQKLWNNFSNFGQSIGEKNLSVWFVIKTDYYTYIDIPCANRYKKIQPVDNSEIYTDVARCKEYCDKFELDYNEGPFIIVTEKHPDISSKKDVIVIKFNNILPSNVILFLNNLEQKIRTRKPIKEPSKLTYLGETIRTWLSEHKKDIIELSKLVQVNIPSK